MLCMYVSFPEILGNRGLLCYCLQITLKERLSACYTLPPKLIYVTLPLLHKIQDCCSQPWYRCLRTFIAFSYIEYDIAFSYKYTTASGTCCSETLLCLQNQGYCSECQYSPLHNQLCCPHFHVIPSLCGLNKYFYISLQQTNCYIYCHQNCTTVLVLQFSIEEAHRNWPIRAVAPTPAGPAMAGPVFLLDIDLRMRKLCCSLKLDVGREKPRLKQLSGAGKSTMIR